MSDFNSHKKSEGAYNHIEMWSKSQSAATEYWIVSQTAFSFIRSGTTFGGFRFYLLFCTLDMNWQHRHEHNDIAITGSDGTGDVVQAVTNYQDAKLLAELSEDLGEAMVGINEQVIEQLMAERGK